MLTFVPEWYDAIRLEPSFTTELAGQPVEDWSRIFGALNAFFGHGT